MLEICRLMFSLLLQSTAVLIYFCTSSIEKKNMTNWYTKLNTHQQPSISSSNYLFTQAYPKVYPFINGVFYAISTSISCSLIWRHYRTHDVEWTRHKCNFLFRRNQTIKKYILTTCTVYNSINFIFLSKISVSFFFMKFHFFKISVFWMKFNFSDFFI